MTVLESHALVAALARTLRSLPPARLASAGSRGAAYPIALLEALDSRSYVELDRRAAASELLRRSTFRC